MTQRPRYIEWDREPAKPDSPFDDPIVRERIAEIIVRGATALKKTVGQ